MTALQLFVAAQNVPCPGTDEPHRWHTIPAKQISLVSLRSFGTA